MLHMSIINAILDEPKVDPHGPTHVTQRRALPVVRYNDFSLVVTVPPESIGPTD